MKGPQSHLELETICSFLGDVFSEDEFPTPCPLPHWGLRVSKTGLLNIDKHVQAVPLEFCLSIVGVLAEERLDSCIFC